MQRKKGRGGFWALCAEQKRIFCIFACMKKIFFLLFVLTLSALAGAQTIQVGDRFYDGVTLFTVQEVRMGNIVYMADGFGDRELTLEKWPDTPGT